MTGTNRGLDIANLPIESTPTMGLITSVGTTATLLFSNLSALATGRRIRVVNTHASQTLALILLPVGTSPSGQTVDSGPQILAGRELALPILAGLSVYIVGSAATTTLNACTSDT